MTILTLLTIFSTVPIVALLTMFSKVLSMKFSTAFLLSFIQFSLGCPLSEAYIVRITINIYSVAPRIKM